MCLITVFSETGSGLAGLNEMVLLEGDMRLRNTCNCLNNRSFTPLVEPLSAFTKNTTDSLSQSHKGR